MIKKRDREKAVKHIQNGLMLTCYEAAKLADTSPQGIYSLITNGKLETYDQAGRPRILSDDLKTYLLNRWIRNSYLENNALSVPMLAKKSKTTPQRIYYLIAKKLLKYKRLGSAYLFNADQIDIVKKINKG